jgi:hypothetical protein
MAETKGTTADKIRWRDEDRETSRRAANLKEYEGPVTLGQMIKGGGDKVDFMETTGKEGIKRQQEHMRAIADDTMYDYNHIKSIRQAKTSSKYPGVK